MNKIIEHTINSRILTTFDTIDHELMLHYNNNYLFDLSHLDIIELNGAQSFDFLQGQLTCDLRLVSDTQMIQGIQCNLKGRILSLLDVIFWGNYKLILPVDQAELTQSSLSKTAQLSRVSFQKNPSLKVYGFYLQSKEDLIPDNTFLLATPYALAKSSSYCYYHLGNGFYIFIIQAEIEQDFCRPFQNRNQLLGSLTWHTLRLYKQQINIYPISRGLFLPHRLGLHHTQYISFDKGCYKGQEIIARTHYKATIKHELTLFVVQSDQKIFSGQRLLKADEDTELGELIDYSLLGNNTFLIAVSILKQTPLMVRFEGQNQILVLKKIIEKNKSP